MKPDQSSVEPLLKVTPAGIYCAAGGFFIDPKTAVSRAVITHAHADHFSPGCAQYICSASTAPLLRHRLSTQSPIVPLQFHEPIKLGATTVTLIPAGHILGSAQVRIESDDSVWCVTGDYYPTATKTCEPFESVTCDTLITESTFAHPFFCWPNEEQVAAQIDQWWQANQADGIASFIYAYALGKAQRVLGLLNPNRGPIYVTRQVDEINQLYRQGGISLPEAPVWSMKFGLEAWPKGLFILQPSARYRQPFPFAGHYRTAFASGWMLDGQEAAKRRVDTGFVLSDHADSQQLLQSVIASKATQVFTVHGYADLFAEKLNSLGIQSTRWHLPDEHELDHPNPAA